MRRKDGAPADGLDLFHLHFEYATAGPSSSVDFSCSLRIPLVSRTSLLPSKAGTGQCLRHCGGLTTHCWPDTRQAFAFGSLDRASKYRTDVDVDFLLTGDTTFSATRFGVDALLTAARPGRCLWAQSFEQRFDPM